MERKEAIRGAYRMTGGNSFYDGMITCSTLSGKAVCRLVWAMNKAENDAYLEKARMQALNKRDVSIDYAFMVTVEKIMRHGCENVPDYMLSGSRGDFTGVGDIHFFYSADEVLYGALPDFEEACKRANVPYTVSARPKMVHCYCMLPIFKEAKEDFAKIVDFLKK